MRSSRCRRGDVAPVISVSAALTRSAARDSSATPRCCACVRMRSSWSAGWSRRTACASSPGDRDDDEVAQALQHVLDEAPRLVPRRDDVVHDPEDARAVARGEGVHDVVEQGGVGEAEERDRALVLDGAVLGARDELVHDGQRVADRAATRARHERDDAAADRHALGRAELLEVGAEHVRRDEAEG